MSSYTIPYVVEKRAGSERAMDVFSRLLSDRIVYLGTAIDEGVANVLIAQLIHLESDNPDLPINLYINSPGGDIPATLSVYDAMQYVRAPVATTCLGQAATTAALLLAGGAKGQRSILAHGRVVLHQPTGQGRGTVPDLILAADEIVRVRGQLEEVLSAHTGQSVETLRRDTDRELILDAERAVSYGVVDHVLTERPV